MSSAPAIRSSASANMPASEQRLKQIVTEACDAAFRDATTYDHAQTQHWNQAIINNVLQSLVSDTTPTGTSQPPFRFAVNSTIIDTSTVQQGIHSATGGYWDNEKDGVWHTRYEGAGKGLGVIVSISWFSV
ncbi:hypothetical protein H2203_000278 [Taxawa tesnikishii (nom. ined.)]|nr:hypothetical protein H2203_000278 [Dothideales sp. JES 119]